MSDRRELLERYGRCFGELGLALTFTRTNDPAKGDPKQGVSGWPDTAPLPHAAAAVGLMTARGQHRNPALVARASRLIVIETDTPDQLAEFEALGLPPTVTVQSSAPYRRHHWFRPWAEMPTYASIRLEAAGVTVDENRLYLVPPAIHTTGLVYSFLRSPEDTAIAVLPERVYRELVRKAGRVDEDLRTRLQNDAAGKVSEGWRRRMLFRYACALRRWTADQEEIALAVHEWNRRHCDPPVERHLVDVQITGAMRKPGWQALEPAGRVLRLGQAGRERTES